MALNKQACFQLLGILPTTDKGLIKKAYRKKAFQYHPDRNKLPSSHEKFIQITEAYEVLIEEPRIDKSDAGFSQKTAEEVLAERIRAATARYRQAQKKEAEEDLIFYNTLIGDKFGRYFKWFGYVAAVVSVVWVFDYLLNSNGVYINVEEYFWTGPEICFNIENKDYCFDSRQAAGLGRYWEVEAHFSPVLGDLKYVVAKDYVGDLFRIYPYRTFSYTFPYVPVLMFLPLLTWRFRQPAPWFVFFYFISWFFVGGALLFRVISLFL